MKRRGGFKIASDALLQRRARKRRKEDRSPSPPLSPTSLHTHHHFSEDNHSIHYSPKKDKSKRPPLVPDNIEHPESTIPQPPLPFASESTVPQQDATSESQPKRKQVCEFICCSCISLMYFQGVSKAHIRPFWEIRATLQARLLDLHYDPATLECCCTCKASCNALFRCRDCWLRGPQCQACLLQDHRFLPFHHTEKWNGLFYEVATLRDLGAVLPLCHRGECCPNRASRSLTHNLTVFHTNGVHQIHVEYCQCPGTNEDSRHLQLIDHRLFPATLLNPQTAFTLDALDEFSIHLTVSKKSAYHYVKCVESLSDAVLPREVKVTC